MWRQPRGCGNGYKSTVLASSRTFISDKKYQELIRKLESLDKALKYVNRLSGPTADNIKYAALICRYVLEEFCRKVTKLYERTLGVRSAARIAESTKRKL